MTQYIFHTTSQNERWDSIALKYYGSAYRIKNIIEANPHINLTPILDEGIVLKIPVVKEKTPNSMLPVWKRQDDD